MTHDLDLNAILERARKESYQAGYNAALQEVARFINTSLGKSLEGIFLPRRLGDGRPRLVEGSLAAIVLSKIEAHPDGIFAVEIKDWLRSGNSRYAGQAEAAKRVDTTLTRLKSRWGVIVKKDDGKWYRVTPSSGDRSEAA
jgi:Bacteriophage HK97-gp10, putative tail-component